MVARVEHEQHQRASLQAVRKYLVPHRQRLGDEAHHLGHDRPQIDGHGRHAVGTGQCGLEPFLGDEPELVEVGAQPASVQDLVLDGLLELPLGDDAAIAEDARENGQRAAMLSSSTAQV